MRAAPVIASVPDDFDPIATIGHNQPAPSEFDLIKTEIEDLFMEATNWCDGEPIADQATHDAIERLYDGLHAAGAKAEKLRVKEKEPFDTAIAEIQARFAPLIADNKSAKGKVTLGKQELSKLLTPWRTAKAAAAAAEAARIAEAAVAAKRAADEAMRASAGNLAAREEAEAALADAKRLEKTAKRADRAATVGTGLRTVWRAELVDEEAAMDWLWARAKEEVLAVAQRNADEVVRGGVRVVPGFRVVESKVAS
ncbi:hypothetical protein HFN98_24595 [Rhizobium laguerreae]|uniref:hypothetical protein n=1 Tax=Rhizobium laguerreae TaxID=1076926 RepID=UPI001C91B7FD|nr:hypothetical protein [Rhizobium laguerreae]MBY3333773.1 hypothetical protein [Rhizobium laguerreae]